MNRTLRNRGAALGAAVLALTTMAGNCQSPARFEPGTDDSVFGTLIDDRGNFEFNRDDAGNIVRVDATGGVINLADATQDLLIERDDGSSIELEPSGESDVLIVVRGDPTVEDIDLLVSRDSLGDNLGALVRSNSGAAGLCAQNRDSLDGGCGVILGVDLPTVVADVRADLMQRGEDPPSAELLTEVLLRYLILPVDCCLAWEELREELDVDPCAS
jgi:hypothetical protein